MFLYVSVCILFLGFIPKYSTLRFVSSVFNKPASFKTGEQGDDAWIESELDLAAFDGVGDWKKKGIDAGRFARHVALTAASLIEVERSLGTDEVNMKKVLQFSIGECKRQKIFGSCTACIASLNPSIQLLQVFSIGDAQAIIFRQSSLTNIYELSYRTKTQYHRENAPYQIGYMEETNSKITYRFDAPSNGLVEFLPILDGDLVIVSSDGLYDNVSIQDITSIINANAMKAGSKTMKDLATNIVQALGSIIQEKIVAYSLSPSNLTVNSSIEGNDSKVLVDRLKSILPFPKRDVSKDTFVAKDDDITIVCGIVCT